MEIIIKPKKGMEHYWRDIWEYRELLYFLSWRDILVRYKQTLIGIAWSVIRPLLTMLVFTLVFGRIAKLPSDGMPYAILVLTGLLPWQFFSTSLTESSNSLVVNSNMISKVFFPRIIVPLSAIIVCLIDFIISALLLCIFLVYYRLVPGWQIVALPAFTCLAIMLSTGLGLWLSALNVKYRDFRYIVPFIIQFGIYISPVGFSSSLIPEKWRFLYSLNPIAGIIDGFRWSILGTNSQLYMPGIILSIIISTIILITGIIFFRKTERTMADVI